MKDRVVKYVIAGTPPRERERTVRYCPHCDGWHTLLPDGTLARHGSIGWSCDGKKMDGKR